VPLPSHPNPPAIISVENCPSFLMSTYSFHILSPLVFSIDNSTDFPSADFIFPETKIMSAFLYEDSSTFTIICWFELDMISVVIISV